ncbi:MAG: hypothetical protein JW909_12365 [Planctomycetes bacterium]|nr:hypothetical protein [Planctomycetota bacterium]
MSRRLVLLSFAVLFAAASSRAETRVLLDFESDDTLRFFDFKQKSSAIVPDHATHGEHSMRITNGEYMVSWRPPVTGSWAGFDVLRFDYYNDTRSPVKLYILVGDQAWRDKDNGTYWNRHNGGDILLPGAGTITIPIRGLYRGEAGSRNNDIKRNIDVDSIVRLDLGFSGQPGSIYIDHLRLESASLPAFLKAFDFGPASQPLEPGFTCITWDTLSSAGAPFGFHPRRRPWHANRARDDTFPTPLLQDFVETNECTFQVSIPDGSYHVWMVYDDCGYWGGEQARHVRREVVAEGSTVYSETRPLGWAHSLYDFQDVEALPGTDFWQTYMTKLFRPVEFDVQVAGGVLDIEFKADNHWSSKVAALIIYPAENRTEGDRFISGLWAAQRSAFLAKAIDTTPAAPEMPPGLKSSPVVLFSVGKDEAVSPNTVPAADRILKSVDLSAARGENEPVIFGIRANTALSDVSVELSFARAGARQSIGLTPIPASAIKPQVAWYLGRRSFNNIAYNYVAHTLRPASGFSVPAGLARQVWVDIAVPENTLPDRYSGSLVVKYTAGDRENTLTVPVALTILPFRLDDTPFNMGFYGITPPGLLDGPTQSTLQDAIFSTLRSYRMNTFSGGPDMVLRGFRNGEPDIDFSAMDAFMKQARENGFDRPYVNYGGGGISGLYSRHGYVIGDEGKKLAQDTGLDYEEVCRRAFEAYRKHAEANNYLPLILGLVDETRVKEVAREQLVLQRALNSAAPWLKTGGSYSVSFSHPNPGELERLLQEMFVTLRVNFMNNHDAAVVAKANEVGNELWIYNQGQSRYSFGFYQWAEYAKGIKGRMQWHLFVQHGWQYFDLDGREPDTGVIAYHSKLGILPTVNLARIREGVEDMLYCQTLSNLLKRRPNHPAAGEARRVLDRIEKDIAVHQNSCPGWLDQDDYRKRISDLIVEMSK